MYKKEYQLELYKKEYQGVNYNKNISKSQYKVDYVQLKNLYHELTQKCKINSIC